MFTKHFLLAVISLISICVGSSMAWSNRAWFAGASVSETRIDFDQVFADAVWQGEFKPSFVGDAGINRAAKSDRLPAPKSLLPEAALLPNCEPVAAPYADPVLGRVVGRCDV